MEFIFDPPVSTSNLHAPEFDSVWKLVSQSFTQPNSLQSGDLVRELEKRLCRYHDSQFCVTFSTGFWALVAAASLKAIPEKSEVIIPSMTYRRLADVVYWTGKIPVFVDVEPPNLAVCPGAVEAAINDDTALILGVHPIVNCCDVNRLMLLAKANSIPIVFDAVESVHETVDGKRVGSFGVGEVFSFHASKLLNGLEGGYVCTDDLELRDLLVRFRDGVFDSDASRASINGVMNEVHAAFAIAELNEVQSNVAHNETIYRHYLRRLEEVDGIDVLMFDDSQQTSFKNVVARVSDVFPMSRDELVDYLNALGALARPHYYPALHAKRYDYPVKIGEVKFADSAMRNYINLPCGSRVSVNDVDQVCDLIASAVMG